MGKLRDVLGGRGRIGTYGESWLWGIWSILTCLVAGAVAIKGRWIVWELTKEGDWKYVFLICWFAFEKWLRGEMLTISKN